MAGPISNDRKLAAEVRRMGLGKIKRLFEKQGIEPLSDREQEMHDQLLLRMAPNLLPRLTEITGEDGERLFAPSAIEKDKVDEVIKSAVIAASEDDNNTSSQENIG